MPDSPHILTPQQGKVLADKARMILYSGGYGCGKTLFGCYWVINKSRIPGNVGTIYSPTIKMGNDNILSPNLLPILDATIGKNYVFKKAKDEYKILLNNGSEIRIRAFDDEGKLRGSDVNWIWLDEAIGRDRMYLTHSRFNQVISRLRKVIIDQSGNVVSDPEQMLITTNPGSQLHFLYDTFFKSPDEDVSVHLGTIYDNPHLTDAYIRQMEATHSFNDLNGIWDRNVGVVYQDFDSKTHVKDFQPSPNWDYYLAIDWGYTNPFACLLIGVDNDYNYYIVDEIFLSKHLIDEIIPIIKSQFIDHYKIDSFTCDSADPGAKSQLIRDTGIGAMIAGHDLKFIKPGIKSVKAKLKIKNNGVPSILVHPSCVNLINEFHAYVWKIDPDGKETEFPVKKDDHGLDGLRYFCNVRKGFEHG